jgi:hypothetical protein
MARIKTPSTHMMAGAWHVHGDELGEIILLKCRNDAPLQRLIIRNDVPNV